MFLRLVSNLQYSWLRVLGLQTSAITPAMMYFKSSCVLTVTCHMRSDFGLSGQVCLLCKHLDQDFSQSQCLKKYLVPWCMCRWVSDSVAYQSACPNQGPPGSRDKPCLKTRGGLHLRNKTTHAGKHARCSSVPCHNSALGQHPAFLFRRMLQCSFPPHSLQCTVVQKVTNQSCHSMLWCLFLGSQAQI